VKPRTASRLAWTLFALGTVVFAIASWLSIAAHDAPECCLKRTAPSCSR
jgi:hypothetical protein